MPVRVAYISREEGEALDVEGALAWLRRGGISLTPHERKFLGVFLMSVNATYGFLRQDAFMVDLRALINPRVIDDLFRSPSVKAARERFQTERLQHKLQKMTSGGGRVEITFVSEPTEMNMSTTFGVSEKHVGISRQGATDLYTGGFAGCLGMLITPTQGPGGVLAHIAQQGAKGGYLKSTYLLDSTEGVLQLAGRHWEAFDMTLLIGDVDGSDIELRNLPAEIRGKCPSGQKIRHVQDLRAFRERAGQFLFNSRDKVLYLLKQSPPLDSLLACAEFSDEAPKIDSGALAFSSSKLGLKWHLFE